MRIAVAAVVVAVVACGGDDVAPPDAGGAPDAGADADAHPDAGPGTDSGTDADTGTDAGGDAGADADGGAGGACPELAEPVRVGTIEERAIDEASGIVAGRRNPGVLWVHNDSGDSPRLFAVRASDGAHLGILTVRGATANDWEDVAAAPGPTPDSGWLYAGDIGDNPETRPEVRIVRVAEPAVSLDAPADVAVDGETMTVTYPMRAYNSEALLVDPDTGDLYTVQKNTRGRSRVFRIGPFVAGATVAAEVAGDVASDVITGGDVSPDGREILLRSYFAVRLWRRAPGESLADALRPDGCLLPMPDEPQGEAIGWALDASGFYTVSESVAQPLWFVARR